MKLARQFSHSKFFRRASLLILLFGACVRLDNVWRPADRPSWREADEAAMARNFAREGMNPLLPRIDWRGATPGYTESEFPIYPYSIALLYKIFGVHEFIGRILSYIFSVLALFVFSLLARRYLNELGALAASLCFAVSPVVLSVAASLQPDGLMFLFYLAAAFFFTRWLDENRNADYYFALALTALALLAKLPAANIGILFALLVLARFGFNSLRMPKLWLLAGVALAPALLWYAYARTLWTTYGNSLGLSNEYHGAGTYLIRHPTFLLGIPRIEITYVWTLPGVISALVAVLLRRRARAVKLSLFWLAAIFLFYFASAYTTAREWAFYYHIFSAAPFALLFGVAASILFNEKINGKEPIEDEKGRIENRGVIEESDAAMRSPRPANEESGLVIKSPRLAAAVRLTLAVALVLTLALLIRQSREVLHWDGGGEMYSCAKNFAALMPENNLILASGGECEGPFGYPVAYNASYIFYWTNREGFNICTGEQRIERVEDFRRRGAKFFIAEKSQLNAAPGFENELRNKYKLLGDCDGLLIFDLEKKTMNAE